MENGWCEYRCITWSLKNRPHIYIFDEKFLWTRDSFSHYDFVIFPVFYMRIMQSENFATDIHAHYRQSETAPYIRALYTREISPPDIYNNCGAFGICGRLIGCWYLGVRLYHAFVYAVIVWIRTFLLIGWCQSLVVKVWLDCINSL